MIVLGVFILIAVLILVSPVIRSLAVMLSLLCLVGAGVLGILFLVALGQTVKQNNERAKVEVSYAAPAPQHVSAAEFNEKVEEIKRKYVAAGRQADPREARREAAILFKDQGTDIDPDSY